VLLTESLPGSYRVLRLSLSAIKMDTELSANVKADLLSIGSVRIDPGLLSAQMGSRATAGPGAGGASIFIRLGDRRVRFTINELSPLRAVPKIQGGMKTSHGPECLTSLAIPIHVLDEDTPPGLKILVHNVPLPVSDVNGRIAHTKVNYGHIWEGTDRVIRVEKDRCLHHPDCAAMRTYPTDAISNNFVINRDLCINCGTCTLQCSEGVFLARLGSIELTEGTVPISLRQSDRARAERLCTMLKNRILKHEFMPTQMLEPL